MIIKNFKSLALSKERKIALEIVKTGLKALDYEKIDFEKYIPGLGPDKSGKHPGNKSGGHPGRLLSNTSGKYQGNLSGRNPDNKNIYLIGFGKGSSKIADILRKKIKFKEIYVIDVEPTDKHGFKTDKRGSTTADQYGLATDNKNKLPGYKPDMSPGLEPDKSGKHLGNKSGGHLGKLLSNSSGKNQGNDNQYKSALDPRQSAIIYPHQSILDPHESVIVYFKGTHPLPSRKNFLFTKKIIERFQGRLTKDDLVIVLVCGGGSAMLVYPNIPLKKYIQVNQELLKSGANIYEMNTIRKHLDLVKGGGLLKILYPAKVISFIFSDVPGNDLSFIASGPTVKDKTKIADALKIIKKYKLKSVKKEDLIETPKEEKYFKNVKNILALSNLTALKAMKEKAESLGFRAKILTDNLKGDVKDVAKFLFQEIKKSKEKILIVGGETTVKAKGKGKGGRNQELVLWFLKLLYSDINRIKIPGFKPDISNKLPGYQPDKSGRHPGSKSGGYPGNNFLIISLNSDGWDNTEFAGAIGDKMTLEKAEKLKLDIDKFLENNDSFHFFKKTKDGIITGRLPINVADLIILYRG
jgi:glycerate 2-kinase